MKNNEKRMVWEYEWVRIIATVLVVIGHSAYLCGPGGNNYHIPDTIDSAYYSGVLLFVRKMSGWVYGFHMPCFFMLSGAVLALKPLKKFDEVIFSKIYRLIVPYLAVGLLYMLPLKWFANYYSDETIKTAVMGFLRGQESSHLWFLPALFWCILICVLILKILEKSNVQSDFLFLLTAGIVQIIYNQIPSDILILRRGCNEGYIFWFAFGYVFEHVRRKNMNGKKYISPVVCFILMTMVEYIQWKWEIFDSFAKILVGALWIWYFALVMVKICERYEWNNCLILQVLHRNLFYIYLFHDPLNYCLLRLFFGGGLLEKNSVMVYLYLFCRTIGVILVAIFIGELLERMKKRWRKINEYKMSELD